MNAERGGDESPGLRARWWRRAALALVAGVGLASIVLSFIARPYRVEGASMQPTLEAGDVVLVVLLDAIAEGTPEGGLVLVELPGGEERVVKRLVGREGQRVRVEGDNRRASRDSRAYGPLPEAALAGRVVWRLGPVFGPLPERAGPGER